MQVAEHVSSTQHVHVTQAAADKRCPAAIGQEHIATDRASTGEAAASGPNQQGSSNHT